MSKSETIDASVLSVAGFSRKSEQDKGEKGGRVFIARKLALSLNPIV
jgi:hypothetical protein